MPLSVQTVARPVRDPRIPDQLAPATLVLSELRACGALRRLGSALPVSRRGGYTGLPIVALAVAILVSKPAGGVRRFLQSYKRPLKRVAAVAGCRALPSQGSLSRGLRGLTTELVHRFTEAALTDVPGMSKLLQHSSVAHLDACGEPWHVLDIDPTVEAHRVRDLVRDDQRPEPQRIAPGVPGYTGQKRGEVRVRHVPVLHAGAGLWLAYRHAEDNVHLSRFIEPLVAHSRDIVVEAGVDPRRIIFRADGEFGAAGVIGAIVDQGVHVVTRLSRYALFVRPEVVEGLDSATWSRVPSTTGKVRQAAELGTMVLSPDAKAADAEARAVTVRVVVSRTPRQGEARHGVMRGDHQLELFATTLPTDRWPAGDVVALYSGRATIENRFAQEDRELNLEHTYCYSGPGQAFMIAVGLFLWNTMTCAGFLKSPPPSARKTPPPREVPDQRPRGVVTETSFAHASALALAHAEQRAESTATEEVEGPASQQHDEAERSEPVPRAIQNSVRARPPHDPFEGMPAPLRKTLGQMMGSAFADLKRWDGWEVDTELVVARCPGGKRLFPFSVGRPAQRRPKHQVIIRTDVGACDGCPLRSQCFSSSRRNSYKQIARAVTPEQAESVSAILEAYRPARAMRLRQPNSTRRRRRKRGQQATGPAPEVLPSKPLVSPTDIAISGPTLCERPTFLPAAARASYLRDHQDVQVEVRFTLGPRRPLPHPLTAPPSHRARLRKTWSERDARWRTDAPVRLIRHVPPGRLGAKTSAKSEARA